MCMCETQCLNTLPTREFHTVKIVVCKQQKLTLLISLEHKDFIGRLSGSIASARD